MTTPKDVAAVAAALSAPFRAHEVKWKPQKIVGSRALVVAYIDARQVMERLDAVLGVGGWQTSYREVPGGVACRLRVRLGGEWCEHEDVGSYSEQPDEGDRVKAGYSDALKRVAVHLSIGRHLYRVPPQWVDYDPAKKRVTGTPALPESAALAVRDDLMGLIARASAAPTLDAVRELARAYRATLGEGLFAELAEASQRQRAKVGGAVGKAKGVA